MIFLIAALAVARLTRLVRDDTIFEGPRGWVYEWLSRQDRGVRHWLYTLLRCPWCVSGWLAAGATAAADHWYSVPLPALWWLACWWVACFAYWLIELTAETHDEIWRKRES